MVNFIIVLSVLVLFHELGHHVAARYFGVTVESFSIGMGPRLFGVNWKGTDFKVCLLPLGGYVKMAGGAFVGTPTGDPGELLSKPRWQRLIIALMGPIFNFLLAIGLLAGMYMYSYERPLYTSAEPEIAYVQVDSAAAQAGLEAGDIIRSIDSTPTPTWQDVNMHVATIGRPGVPLTFERDGVARQAAITVAHDDQLRELPDPGWGPAEEVKLHSVEVGSPADEAGMEPGDVLERVDGVAIVSVRQVIDVVGASVGRALEFSLLRDGQPVTVAAKARVDEASGSWRMGVELRREFESVNDALPVGAALKRSLVDNYGFAGMILRTLRGLVLGQFSVKTLEGPVGIYRHTQSAASEGARPLILLMALISMNLGIINLMPVPVLDGGHIVLLVLETMLRRDVGEVARNRITQAGLLFILVLFGFVMYNDVMRYFFGP